MRSHWKFSKSLILILALTACISLRAEEKPITIGLIGDSTVADRKGWGPAFKKRSTAQATIWNHAVPGATLDSLSKELNVLLEKSPDYVLIQFGHNDMKRFSIDQYSTNLRSYLERIKQAGGKTVVFSSITRRYFNDEGKIKPRVIKGRILATYAKAAGAVANEMGVPFIDFNTITIAYHNELGPEKSAAFNPDSTDHTHLSEFGAKAISGLIVQELVKTVPELAPYFTSIASYAFNNVSGNNQADANSVYFLGKEVI